MISWEILGKNILYEARINVFLFNLASLFVSCIQIFDLTVGICTPLIYVSFTHKKNNRKITVLFILISKFLDTNQ